MLADTHSGLALAEFNLETEASIFNCNESGPISDYGFVSGGAKPMVVYHSHNLVIGDMDPESDLGVRDVQLLLDFGSLPNPTSVGNEMGGVHFFYKSTHSPFVNIIPSSHKLAFIAYSSIVFPL